MQRDRWHRIDNVLQAALALNPAERTSFLDKECEGDETLRYEVISLLSFEQRTLDLIDTPALELAAPLLVSDESAGFEGQLIGHYQILSLLGIGGMGEVYLAKDEKLKRRIALKLLPVDYTKNKDRLLRFQQEAQAASALNHPGILTIHELGELDGQQFIATEFVEGETLRQRMKRGDFKLSEVLDVTVQVAGALAAAHKAGIVHRDIKPENVMLRPDGYVKVLDFGLAKLTEQPEPKVETHGDKTADISSGSVMGTVRYMSPEQVRGTSVDLRTDIFSLGVMLYEMLSGGPPFRGEIAIDLIKSILNDEPPPLRNRLSGASEDLQRVVSKALAKDKTNRYQTAEDLLADLKAIKRRVEHSSETLAPTAEGRATSTQDLGIATESSVEYLVNQIRQHQVAPIFMLVAFIIVVVAGGSGLYKFFKSRSTPNAFQDFDVTKVTNFGDAWAPAISRDGVYVAYAKITSEGLDEFSVWLRAVGTSNEVQLVPPTEGRFYGTTFSPDGKYLYYTAQLSNQPLTAFMIPVLGGNATKLTLQGAPHLSFSPDGKRNAYLRNLSDGKTAVLISNADGTNQHEIVTRQAPNTYYFNVGPAWSPDGKLIACVGQNGTETFPRVFEVNVE